MWTIHISLLAIACPRLIYLFWNVHPLPPSLPLVGLTDCKAQCEPYYRAKHYVDHKVGWILCVVLFRSERDLTFVSSCKIPILNSKKNVLITSVLARTRGIRVEFE
jgi:hypothetical protein